MLSDYQTSISFSRVDGWSTDPRVLVGHGSGLSISNIGSFYLTSLLTPLFFSNVHVSAMSKNLILVSGLCADNPIISYSLTFSFRYRIVTWGVTLVCDQHRDDVYYWSTPSVFSPSFVILSSVLPCRYLYVEQSSQLSVLAKISNIS